MIISNMSKILNNAFEAIIQPLSHESTIFDVLAIIKEGLKNYLRINIERGYFVAN